MSMRHSLKSETRRSKKNWRWDDQAWSRERIISNNLCKRQSESHFSNHISHFETRRKTRYWHTFAANSLSTHYSKWIFIRENSLARIHRNSESFTESHQVVQKKEIAASEKAYNRHALEEKQFTNKTFIFIHYRLLFKNTNTIQSFREVRQRNRLILRDFHYTHQDFIAARQKDLELDFDYNLSFKLFSSVISNQFFRKFILDSSSDTNLFDLEAREWSSISLKQSSSSSSFHHVRRRYQNDLSIQDNATERFFRISNMTERNEESTNSHESLTLRRDRECRVNRVNFRRSRVNLRRCCLDLSHLNHSWKASQDQDKQSQSCDDYEKSIEMQRQRSSERRNQREKRVKNSEELVQLVRVKNAKRSADQALNYYFRQQSRRHELRSTIQNDNAKHSKNDYQFVDQW